MSSAGIELSEEEDSLIWSRDEKRGYPTIKIVHLALIEDDGVLVTKWWHKYVWKGNLPLKIRCFLWLALENKLLTKDNF